MQRRAITRLTPGTATGTILIPLPPVLWRPIDGGCDCSHCRGPNGPKLTPCWDTLAVPEQRPTGAHDYTSTVHAPELHSIVQRIEYHKARLAGTIAPIDATSGEPRIDIGSPAHRGAATRKSRTRVDSHSAVHPKCSDLMFGYGIGNCCGCNRFPVLLYKSPQADIWRCESCYRKEHGAPPHNRVTA